MACASRPLLLLGGLVASCSLANPPSDYFDESGGKVTIAVAETSVEALAVTESNVYFVVDSAIRRVPKTGGVVVTVQGFEEGASIRRMAGDGASLVAWCDPRRGVSYYDEATAKVTVLPDSTECTSVAVTPAAVAYATARSPAGRPESRMLLSTFVKHPLSGADTSVGPFTGDDSARVALAADGTLYVLGTALLGRTCTPGDRNESCLADRPLCILSSRLNVDPETFFVEREPQGTRIVVSGATVLTAVELPDQCCPVTLRDLQAEGGAGVALCRLPPQPKSRGSVETTVTLYRGLVYRLEENRIVERAVAALDQDGTVAKSGLGQSLRHLAMDDRSFFFVDERKIQRAPR